MNLYLVTCRGMTGSIAGGTADGVAYVVANDPNEAYEKLRRYLVDKDLGFGSDRQLRKVELLAEEGLYPTCSLRLFL